MLEQLLHENSPWDYCNAIENYEVPPQHRGTFYQGFITMVAQCNDAQADALLERGKQVFHYRLETARKNVQELRNQGMAGINVTQPSVIADDFMAEMIYIPDSMPSTKYLVYRLDGTSEVVDTVQVGEVIYHPPRSVLIDQGVISLPTGIEEYGDQDVLFRDIRSFILNYLHLTNEKFRNIITYYIFLTWIFDKFTVVPYLRAQGEFGSGKTRLLQVVGALANRGVMAGGATTASPIFRIMNRFKPTLIIDEADFSESDLWSEIVKILNIGYQKGFHVLRSERSPTQQDNFDVTGFDCYGPKVLSTRKRFGDHALESRCLSYTMQNVPVPANIPFILTDGFLTQARSLRNKLLLWRFQHYRNAVLDPYERISGLDARLNQITLPLMACAEDESMKRMIRQHAVEYQATLHQDKRESMEGMVALSLLKRWRARPKDAERLLLKEVTDQLKSDYPDMKMGSRGIGEMIRHQFGLSTPERGGAIWITVRETEIRKIAKNYHMESVIESIPS